MPSRINRRHVDGHRRAARPQVPDDPDPGELPPLGEGDEHSDEGEVCASTVSGVLDFQNENEC